ncbi:nitrogen regulation protein NR(I), partial [bacterium]|nr:nitrogen regulation protein NR(I) [bacterium]
GLEFIDRIRRVRPTVPIVVMSSKSWLQDDMAVQTSQQIRAFLVKPVDVNEILDVISKVCSEKSN